MIDFEDVDQLVQTALDQPMKLFVVFTNRMGIWAVDLRPTIYSAVEEANMADKMKSDAIRLKNGTEIRLVLVATRRMMGLRPDGCLVVSDDRGMPQGFWEELRALRARST